MDLASIATISIHNEANMLGHGPAFQRIDDNAPRQSGHLRGEVKGEGWSIFRGVRRVRRGFRQKGLYEKRMCKAERDREREGE